MKNGGKNKFQGKIIKSDERRVTGDGWQSSGLTISRSSGLNKNRCNTHSHPATTGQIH